MKISSLYLRLMLIFSMILSSLGVYLQWTYYRIGFNWKPTFSAVTRFMFALLLVVVLTLWMIIIVFSERKKSPLWRTFLKLLGGMLLPFVFFCFVAVGSISRDRYLRGLHDRLDQTCTELELTDWVENVMKTYKGRRVNKIDDLDSLPVCLARLSHGRSKPMLFLEQDGQLILGWPDFGSSIYGIIFSNPSAKKHPSETIQRIEWKPGIDVFNWPEE